MPNLEWYNDLSTVAANTFAVIGGLYTGISLLKKSAKDLIEFLKKSELNFLKTKYNSYLCPPINDENYLRF